MRYLQIILLVLSIPANAADKALILNDQQQAALRQVLDSAIRANGLSPISRNALGLSDMLDAAAIITERKTDFPKDTAPEAQP